MALLVLVVALLSGPAGLLAAATGTFIGLFAILSGLRRSHLMGYLLLPTILYFSGLSPELMVTLGI
jgi:TctA family transporter